MYNNTLDYAEEPLKYMIELSNKIQCSLEVTNWILSLILKTIRQI